MKIINAHDQPKEGTPTKGDEIRLRTVSFQGSDHFEFVMGIIQEALDKSIVQELISKRNGDCNDTEVGRLTLIEWAAKNRIQEIKDKLNKKYE